MPVYQHEDAPFVPKQGISELVSSTGHISLLAKPLSGGRNICTQGKLALGVVWRERKRQLTRLWHRAFHQNGFSMESNFVLGFLFVCWGFFVWVFWWGFFCVKHKYLISAHCGSDFCQLPLCCLLMSLPGLGSPRAVAAREFRSISLRFGRATSLCRTGATPWSSSLLFVKQQKTHPRDTAKAFLSWTFWL